MENKDQVSSCGLGTAMMSYIYGELAESGRASIDDHLAVCSACTDEFAELSISRFSVYEWKREVFDSIPTPSFVIPFEADAASAGWLAGLRLVLASRTPAVGFAVLAIAALGTGLIALMGTRAPVDVTSVPALEIKGETPAEPRPALQEPVSTRFRRSTAARVQATPTRVAVKQSNRVIETSTRAINAGQQRPSLSNYRDDEDTTLRLSDLFADGGV